MRYIATLSGITGLGLFLGGLAACNEYEEPQVDTAAQQQGGGETVIEGGGSSLGGAKRVANDTADKIRAQQDRALQEMGEEPGTSAGEDQDE